MSGFRMLNLDENLIKAVESKGYSVPTSIQLQAIPLLLSGHDIFGIAQTGTGKTAAFALPILQNILVNKKKMKPARVRSLILTPTRELAMQVAENFKEYSKGFKLSLNLIFGGVGHRAQIENQSKGVDVLVATPGRLLELMDDGHVIYEDLEFLVLDEADRMLDMGFVDDIKKILAELPVKRQTMLFSATMPKKITEFASELLVNPQKVEADLESSISDNIDQKVNVLNRSNKPLLLKSIFEDRNIKSALVFTRTKHAADRVVRHLLKDSISAAAIHGNKTQGARLKALGRFRAGKIRVLVATDIAARGLDIPQVSHVINYHLPDDPKNYVHRIGRTARAGKSGIAISFCDETEMDLLKGIEKQINKKVEIDTTHPFHGVAAHYSKK